MNMVADLLTHSYWKCIWTSAWDQSRVSVRYAGIKLSPLTGTAISNECVESVQIALD